MTAAATALVTFGEAMISLRCQGLIRHGDGFSSSVGGAEANVAIGLSRLGHSVDWVGVVGDDPQGELVARTLRADGVRAIIRTDRDRPTGLMLIEKRLSTTARVSYYRAGSAGSTLTFNDLRPVLQPGVEILHLTGITPALSVSAQHACRAAILAARENGIRISLDLNHRARLWPRDVAAPVLVELAETADILIGSEDELSLLGGDGEDQVVGQCLDQGAEVVVIKRGAAGVTVVSGEERADVAARPVPVVDTIGAGDAFTAGFLSGLLDHLGVVESAERGVAVAAFSVAAEGDWEGLPTRSELTLLDIETGGAVR